MLEIDEAVSLSMRKGIVGNEMYVEVSGNYSHDEIVVYLCDLWEGLMESTRGKKIGYFWGYDEWKNPLWKIGVQYDEGTN